WGAKDGMVAPAAVVFSSTDTVALPMLATSRSGRPSPLTSPTATELGWVPVGKVCWGAKDGVVAPAAVVFSSTDTVPLPKLADRKRGRQGPLADPAATGQVRVEGGGGGRGLGCVQRYRRRGAAEVGDEQVGPAVAVDVPHRHREGAGAGGEGLLGGEGGGGGPGRRRVQQYRHRAAAEVGGSEEGPAGAVGGPRRHRAGAGGGGGWWAGAGVCSTVPTTWRCRSWRRAGRAGRRR